MSTTVIVAQCIILFAFFFRSLTGFGGALLSIPLLGIFFPLKFIVPMEAVLEVALSAGLISSVIRRVDKTQLRQLLPGVLIGSLLGVYFLGFFVDQYLKLMLGVVIIVVALNLLRKTQRNLTALSGWGLSAGIMGGVLGGLFGTSGPAYVAYLSSQTLEKEVFRATLIFIFAVEYSWRLALYAWEGLLGYDELEFAFFLGPALILSTVLGHFLHIRISEHLFRRVVAILMLGSGIVCLL